MLKYINKTLIIVLIFNVTLAFSQDRDQENDTIKTDVVDVIKPYTPTISDAFKVKETPTLNDEETGTKKDVKYNIFSIPVASTFTPAKGKAADVDKAKKARLFDNYASIGFGTYTTILGEVYLNHAINRTESVGAYVNHHSSQGGIEGLLLDDAFSDSKININYAKQLRDYSWNVEAGYQNQNYNWYGLPQPFFSQVDADNLDVKHTFHSVHFGGDLNFDSAIVNDASVLFRRFSDNNGSGENRFTAKSNFNIEVRDNSISTDVKIDYLGGTFDRNYQTAQEINYGNFNVSIAPSYQLIKDDLTVNFGAALYYLNDTEANKSKMFVYPRINASYRLVDDILIAYGGIEGDLIQNSYYGFAQDNPFVSPTLLIAPTDQIYNGFVGLKGKLSNNMSYNVRGSFFTDNNKALFMANPVQPDPESDYTYGNSTGVVYDDVTTLSVFGELNVDVNRNFTLGLKAEYFVYDMDLQAEAWNLPDFKGSLFLDYQIGKHWFTGANLYYVGERKDIFEVTGINSSSTLVTLDSYFDANAHLGYKINDRWSAYIKANNIANQDYQRYLHYPVQGIQFLAGATYKFDF